MAIRRLPTPARTTGSRTRDADDGEPMRRRLVATAKMFEQPILSVFGIAALLFGFVGYRDYFRATGQPSGFVDVLYADIQLIKLSSRVSTADVPWTLNVGRLLAPAVTGYTAFRGVVGLYSDRFDRFRVQVSKRHVVIVGATVAGLSVARKLARRGRRVVLVDSAMTPERVQSLRSIGVLSVAGDGTRPEVLHQARAHRASEVLALTDDDARNIDATMRARELAVRHRSRTRATGAVTRSELCEILRIDSFDAMARDDGPRVDFLNGAELTARSVDRLLARHGARGDILIVSGGVIGAALVPRLLRRGYDGAIRLGGPDAAASAIELRRRFGASIGARVSDDGDAALAFDATSAGDGPVNHAVVVGAGAASIGSALELTHRLGPPSIVIAVVPDPGHLTAAVEHARREPGSAPHGRLLIVDSLAWVSDPELVLGGTAEVIARATHEAYCDTRRDAGTDTPDDPSLRPWAELTPALQLSNRAQAHHVSVKLAAVGCGLGPAGAQPSSFAFTPDEIERLAILEHDRWVHERRGEGWRAGPRDPERKTTPYLVGWDELSEEVRELDRVPVRSLPAFVADLGYRIVRLDGTATDRTTSRIGGRTTSQQMSHDTDGAPR
jgi:voltage-gated potassium channel Kch